MFGLFGGSPAPANDTTPVAPPQATPSHSSDAADGGELQAPPAQGTVVVPPKHQDQQALGQRAKYTVDADFEVDLEARLVGTVVSYYKMQGYGFIKLTQEGLVPNDILFVHWRNLASTDRFPALAKDMEVECSILKWKDRWSPNKVTLRARDVTKPGGDPLALQDEIDREQKEFVGGQDYRYTGTVKFYNVTNGYGYVALDPGFVVEPEVPGELRLECQEINSAGRQPGWMQPGLEVEFGIWRTKRGNYKVYNMTLPGGIPITQDVLENRADGGTQTFHGEVHMWNWRQGWGFIKADPATTLPEEVRDKLASQARSANEKATARGRNASSEEMLYFRQQDVQQGVRLNKGAQVMFKVYTDDKGAGALDIATI